MDDLEIFNFLQRNKFLINYSEIERRCFIPKFTIINCIEGKNCRSYRTNKDIIEKFIKNNLVVK